MHPFATYAYSGLLRPLFLFFFTDFEKKPTVLQSKKLRTNKILRVAGRGWWWLGRKGGAVVKAFASHQCGRDSNPGFVAICINCDRVVGSES